MNGAAGGRPSGRQPDELRPVTLSPGFSRHAEGSCLVKFGGTHVLCTASVETRVPPWLRNTGSGWVTAPAIAGAVCFIGLYFMQNVFDQQVYSGGPGKTPVEMVGVASPDKSTPKPQ